MGKIVIHANPSLAHQGRWAQAFKESLPDAVITNSRTLAGDIHIINGPHYCYKHWLGKPNVLMIDRAYWGDPDCVSIGWLQADGGRIFANGPHRRPLPLLKRWKEYRGSACVFAGFREDISNLVKKARSVFDRVYCRHHPQDIRQSKLMELSGPLDSVWELCDVAIGTRSTVLYEAVFNGLATIGDIGSVASDWESLRRPDRSEWLHELSYRQFHITEVRNGTAWELLNGQNIRQYATTNAAHGIESRTGQAR